MSNLTKLATVSLVRVWPAVILTSAGSHGTLQLDVCVSVLVWSWRFSSPERFGADVFKFHPPTLIILNSTDVISVDRCLEWGLMAGLRGFASHDGCILSGGWLDTVEAPRYPRHPPSI